MKTYTIVVCAGIVPDPLQTLEPVRTATGFGLKNEMMLPAVLDPWAFHALNEAANIVRKFPGSKLYLVCSAPKAKLQQVMMTVAQKLPFELLAIDAPAGGFTDAFETAKILHETIESIPDLSPESLMVFGGWESASRSAGSTLQVLGELLGIDEQFYGVDRLTFEENGHIRVLERVEAGQYRESELSSLPAVFGWATGELPEPPNNPQIGMMNMRTIMPALQKAKPTPLSGCDCSTVTAELPAQRRETQVITNMSPEAIAQELYAWIKED